MNRKEFLFSLPLIGGIAKAIDVTDTEDNHVFDRKLLLDRIDYLNNHPEEVEYMYVMYADNECGDGMSNIPTLKRYVNFFFSKDKIEELSVSDFKKPWLKLY